MIQDYPPGDTFRIRWFTTGLQPTSVGYEIIDGAEAAISAGGLVDETGGVWAANYTTPVTPGYYVVKTTAIIDTLTYIRSTSFRVCELEVD